MTMFASTPNFLWDTLFTLLQNMSSLSTSLFTILWISNPLWSNLMDSLLVSTIIYWCEQKNLLLLISHCFYFDYVWWSIIVTKKGLILIQLTNTCRLIYHTPSTDNRVGSDNIISHWSSSNIPPYPLNSLDIYQYLSLQPSLKPHQSSK